MRPAAPERPGFLPYLIVVLAWGLGHLGLAAIGTTPVLEGRIPDTDGYMWLARVELLWRTGAWFDASMPRANAPFGDVLNWTRPLDVAISLLALPASLVLPWRTALFVAGAVVSPLLHLATIMLLAWAARPLLDAEPRPLVAFAALASMGLFAYSVLGRPDHHALMAVALAVLVGGAVRLPLGDGVWLFAIAAAIGIWLTPEFLMPLGLVCAAAIAAWALSPQALGAAIQARAWCAAACATAMAMILERGIGALLVREPDKISLDQLAIVAAAALLWTVLARIGVLARGFVARIVAASVVAAALGLALTRLLPGIERGPDAAIDPRVMAIFLSSTTEMRSLLGWDIDSLIDQLRLNALCVAGAIAAGIWWIRGRDTPRGAAWATIAVLAIGYALATTLHMRFAMFGMIGAAIAVAELLRLVRTRFAGGFGAMVVRATAMAVVLGGPLALGALISARGGGGTVERAMQALDRDCNLSAVAPMLDSPGGAGARPRIVIAHLNFGPELIWRTGHGVLGTPFHRNRDGILDGRAFFDARDDAAARAIAARRGAELVLFCPLLAHENPPGSLGQRLLAHDVPPWLAVEPLARTAFQLYRIDPR